MTPKSASTAHLLSAISPLPLPSLTHNQNRSDGLCVPPQRSAASYPAAFGPSLFPAGRGDPTLVGRAGLPHRLLSEEETERLRRTLGSALVAAFCGAIAAGPCQAFAKLKRVEKQATKALKPLSSASAENKAAALASRL
nr:unnamed protein product [Digitaria exilis]